MARHRPRHARAPVAANSAAAAGAGPAHSPALTGLRHEPLLLVTVGVVAATAIASILFVAGAPGSYGTAKNAAIGNRLPTASRPLSTTNAPLATVPSQPNVPPVIAKTTANAAG